MATHSFHERLRRHFEKQALFARQYSPLVALQCSVLRNMLHDENSWFAKWIQQSAANRITFEVPLLLLAGLHSAVLSGLEEGRELATFYPTVGGTNTLDERSLEKVLLDTILSLQGYLQHFIQSTAVQTNETGRGICWLLPLSYSTLKNVNLVDLGTSAGLNLVADQRRYSLVNQDRTSELAFFGASQQQQFSIKSDGIFPGLSRERNIPGIITRSGCDLSPIHLGSPASENVLTSFIWGDQPQRMKRLQEGITALREMNAGTTPVMLQRIFLPRDLLSYLQSLSTVLPDGPIVLFSSYITNYLEDKGASLFDIIEGWALAQPRTIFWIQMDRPVSVQKVPKSGWLFWQAHTWENNQHACWDLGWCHPHGSEISWLPGFDDWLCYWQDK